MRAYAEALEAVESKNMDAPFPSWMACVLMDHTTVGKMSLVPEDNKPQTLGRGNIDQQAVQQVFHEQYEPTWITEMSRSIIKNLKTTRDWVALQIIDPDLKEEILRQIAIDDGKLVPTKNVLPALKYRNDYADYSAPWMPVGEVAQ